MAGITFDSYRTFFSNFNVGVYYTEMVSDKGLIYGSTETFKYLPTNESVRPIGIQLFGSTKETLVEAIGIIEKTCAYYDFIDLNAGCSVPKVLRGGCGSFLLQNLDKLKEIVSAMVSASSKPVSVKVRLGWNTNNIENIVDTLTQAGASLIAVHARFASQLFRGTPHWELLRNIQDRTTVPIVVSGDIYTLEDAINAITITKAKGVMIARGGIGNPTFALNINEYYNNSPLTPVSTVNQKKYATALTIKTCEEMGEIKGVKILRGLLPKFFNDFNNAKIYRIAITQCNSQRELLDVIDQIKE